MKSSSRLKDTLNPEELAELYQLVKEETKIKLPYETYESMMEGSKLLRLRRREALVEAGKYDANLYIVRSGLIRGMYMSGSQERTVGFALPGTLLFSFHSYTGELPSFYRFEACTPSQVIKISHHHFNRLLEKDHRFALWVMGANQMQLYFTEIKHKLLSGEAKDNLLSLRATWPEIFLKVPAKYIASYLGITEVHLCRIKSELIKAAKGNQFD